MTSAVVLLSGGKDSAVALWWAKSHHDEVLALSVSHPERPRKETDAARRLAELASCQLAEIDLPFLRSTRTLRQGDCGSDGFDTAGAYVPMRNLLIFAAAGHIAEAHQADAVVAGQLASDGEAYTDATSPFFRQLSSLFATCLAGSFAAPARQISIELPLITLSDPQAIALGRECGVPFEASWSCLRDESVPCRSCVSCRDRQRVLPI